MQENPNIRRNTIIEIEELIHECLTWSETTSCDPKQAQRELKREILRRLELLRTNE